MAKDTISTVNCDRLKFAREYYGLDLDTVSQKTKIDSDKILAFEEGRDYPTYFQLNKLAEFYNQSLLFFFFKSAPSPTKLQADFRSVETNSNQIITQRIKEMIEQANLYQLNLIELNQGKSSPSFIKMISEEGVSPMQLAAWLRDKFELTIDDQIKRYKSPEKLLDYIREKFYDIGIYIFKDSFKENSVSGLCLYDDVFPVIILNNKNTFARQLFTVFHEVFHVFLKQTSGCFEKNEEKQCDSFASSFLIPKDHFADTVKKYKQFEDETVIKELANIYCVSLDAIRYRLLSLNLISHEYYGKFHKEYIRQFNGTLPGGNFYYTKISYLGRPYLNSVFDKYYSGQIPISQVGTLTGLKAINVSKLASNYFGGESK